MSLKELTKGRLITSNNDKDDSLQIGKGCIYTPNLYEQTLSLKGENQQVSSIRLSGIKEIH